MQSVTVVIRGCRLGSPASGSVLTERAPQRVLPHLTWDVHHGKEAICLVAASATAQPGAPLQLIACDNH